MGSGSGSASGEDSLQRSKRKGKRDAKRLNKITIFPMKGGTEKDAILRRGKVLKIDKDGRQRVREYVSKMPVLPEEMPTFTDESMSKITKTPMQEAQKYKEKTRDEEDGVGQSIQSSLKIDEYGVPESMEFIMSSDNQNRQHHI